MNAPYVLMTKGVPVPDRVRVLLEASNVCRYPLLFVLEPIVRTPATDVSAPNV